ncbi:hypothetical protein K2Y00_00955 [Patescibacteria group bacterium]|nr:hypothetical protein [Patescibacteria group bacterium]
MPTKEPITPAVAPAAMSSIPSKKVLIALGAAVVLCAAALVYLYSEYATLTQDPNAANERKIAAVVDKVEKIIDLPPNELPTLATVSDTSTLEDQPFFANAEVGDQVLLYTNARKAYLYSPSKNIIVEVASLNIGQ